MLEKVSWKKLREIATDKKKYRGRFEGRIVLDKVKG
jgi:hypothetical protein